MSFIKRISQILTPIPLGRRSNPPEDTPPPSDFDDAEAPRVSEIHGILETLLRDEARSREETSELLSRVKEIAARYGIEMIAGEIRDSVLRMPEKAEDGTPFKTARGFEIAADLFLQYLRNSVHAVEGGTETDRLAKIPGLAGEVLASLFLAKKPVSAVEVCFDIAHHLLQRVCFSSPVGFGYARTAEEIIVQTLDVTLDEATKHPQQQEEESSPDPPDPVRKESLTTAHLQHLAQQRDLIQGLRRRFSALATSPPMRGDETVEETSEASLRAQLDFVVSLAQAAKAENHEAFAAYCLEQAANYASMLKRQDAVAYAREAIRIYEQLAASEQAAGLPTLCRNHRSNVERLSGRWGKE